MAEERPEGRRSGPARRLHALAAGALALAGWLFAAERGVGFALTGESLALDQRDVRVFNNFTDPEANANQQPDTSFPGYVGAELAIWKGCVEWGSELHFDGAGDPLQPGDLGSGGANFDCSWQGRATGEGGLDDNIHSEIAGNGFGVIAFTETPSSDGWRIRYYRHPWVFWDNPNQGPNGNSQLDLQGVACHEYGHALGLGHSNDPEATMFASVLANATNWRSIEDDDRAGIQAIYGPRASTKPSITGYAHLGGGMVEVRGTGFDALANEVWFTQAASGGDGTPVVAAGLPATAAGTAITLAVPPLAGAGDVLVKLPGTQPSALSNAFPFDPTADPCPEPVSYGTGKINSTGAAAQIGWAGTTSASANNFRITLFNGPPGELGLAFSGPGQQATPFYGGWMLVSAPKQRHRSFVVDPFGFGSSKVKLEATMAGDTRYYQVWYRDALDPFGAGTSDALQVTICQ